MRKLTAFLLALTFNVAGAFAETDCLALVTEKNHAGKVAVHALNYGVTVEDTKVFLRIYGGATVTPGYANWQFVNFALTGYYDLVKDSNEEIKTVVGKKSNAILAINLEEGMSERHVIQEVSQAAGDISRFLRKDKEQFSGYIIGKNTKDNTDLTGLLYCKKPKKKKGEEDDH